MPTTERLGASDTPDTPDTQGLSATHLTLTVCTLSCRPNAGVRVEPPVIRFTSSRYQDEHVLVGLDVHLRGEKLCSLSRAIESHP